MNFSWADCCALGLPASIAVPVSALLFAFDPFLVAAASTSSLRIAVEGRSRVGTAWVALQNVSVHHRRAHAVEVIVFVRRHAQCWGGGRTVAP